MDGDLKIVVRMSVDNLALKCYLPDTGLFITMTMGRPSSAEQIYRAFVRNRLSINEGMFFGNSVAQVFKASGYASPNSTSTQKGTHDGDRLLPSR